MKSPSALIFDMDGVLVDSEPVHKRAKEEAFRQFGIVLPEAVYDSYKGRPDATMLPEVLGARGFSPETVAEISRLKHQIFESIKHELRPVDGAADFIRWAAARHRIALATSATTRNRELVLAVLNAGDVFETIVDGSRHTRPKPDPEVFQVAMRELGVGPGDCWVIEDSVNGLLAAKAAGCYAVAITTTFDRATVSAAGADAAVDSFGELRGMLERL